MNADDGVPVVTSDRGSSLDDLAPSAASRLAAASKSWLRVARYESSSTCPARTKGSCMGRAPAWEADQPSAVGCAGHGAKTREFTRCATSAGHLSLCPRPQLCLCCPGTPELQ